TVEDPDEYQMAGVVQVQVQEKAGLTIAAALRSILRQDPNGTLAGEILDRETATIAGQAPLTGHLVLSPLHTNDAANAVPRAADPAGRIAGAARRGGMTPMRDSGLAHVLRGESPIDELMRVVAVPAEAADIAPLAAPAGTPTGSAAHGAHAPGAPPRVAPQP